jgi:SAM-dependent methyltransferase
METQDNIFARSEGDCWFERNLGSLQNFEPAHDLPLKLIELYELRPQSVIEIGAANGFRVAEINRRCGARAVAVELSQQAVADGKARFPFVTFLRGAASAVPVQGLFDLVIINFVFHWIDRAFLLRSVAEVDRLLNDGGFLVIGDFLPANRLQVPYHHLKAGDVTTFKQNYADVFSASGLYHPVGLITAHHATKLPDPQASENERIGAWLMRKQLKSHYLESGLNGVAA